MARRKKARKKTGKRRSRKTKLKSKSVTGMAKSLLRKIKNAPAGVRRDIKKHLGV